MDIQNLKAKAEALASMEYVVESNEGTHSDGDQFHSYKVFERVGGGQRRTGCVAAMASGRARYLSRRELRTARAELKTIRAEITRLEAVANWPTSEPLPARLLPKGTDIQ